MYSGSLHGVVLYVRERGPGEGDEWIVHSFNTDEAVVHGWCGGLYQGSYHPTGPAEERERAARLVFDERVMALLNCEAGDSRVLARKKGESHATV